MNIDSNYREIIEVPINIDYIITVRQINFKECLKRIPVVFLFVLYIVI